MTAADTRHRRQKVSLAFKAQVYRTYGDRCHLCRELISVGERSVDHVKSVRAGGNTLLANCRPAHKTCNEFRGARPLTSELRAEIRARYLSLQSDPSLQSIAARAPGN